MLNCWPKRLTNFFLFRPSNLHPLLTLGQGASGHSFLLNFLSNFNSQNFPFYHIWMNGEESQMIPTGQLNASVYGGIFMEIWPSRKLNNNGHFVNKARIGHGIIISSPIEQRQRTDSIRFISINKAV
jgi:hypothetical protein